MSQEELLARQLCNLNNATYGIAMVTRRLAIHSKDKEGIDLLDNTMIAFSQELAALAKTLQEMVAAKPSIILPH